MKGITSLYELECILPDECVQECCTSGKNDVVIAEWQAKLGLNYFPSDCRLILQEYGAWTHSELLRKGKKELNALVLRLACWNVYDKQETI